MSGFVLTGSYRFVKERGEYIGVVAKIEGTEMTVLTVGAEMSEEAILVWIRDTINIMRAEQKFDVQAPDLYDRMKAASPNPH